MSVEKKVGPAAPQILETDVAGEISLYNPVNESVTILNGTASDVWLLCDGDHTAEEIKDLLAASYGTTRQTVSDDVDNTIDEFRSAGLLQA
jgi:hypothetical protein